MLTTPWTETDRAIAASQPCASGGGRGSGGLSERRGAGKSVTEGTEESC